MKPTTPTYPFQFLRLSVLVLGKRRLVQLALQLVQSLAVLCLLHRLVDISQDLFGALQSPGQLLVLLGLGGAVRVA